MSSGAPDRPPSTALVRKSTDNALMPPPPTKRIKRPATVLDEDTYTTSLSHIIARDFFPGLLETQHQQEYLDALSSNDPAWIADASRRLTEVMNTPSGRRRGTGFETPAWRGRGETPVSNPLWTPGAGATPHTTNSRPIDGKGEGNKKIDTNMSLTAFQSKYTSEDNESFNTLLDKQNAKRREKYAFLWNENHIPGGRQIADANRKQKLLTEKTYGVDGTEQEDPKKLLLPDERKPVPNTWKRNPRNALMFAPDGSPPPEERSGGGNEGEKKTLPDPKVIHSNTRLPTTTGVEKERPPSPTMSFIDAAIAGRPYAETPRVNGYGFVTDSPLHPSQVPPLPTTTTSTTVATPFRIAQTPRREELLNRMVEKVAKNKREASTARRAATPKMDPRRTLLGGGGKGREVPTFKSSPAVTPAGERLWEKLRKGTEVRKSGLGAGVGGKEAWTPARTPRVTKK